MPKKLKKGEARLEHSTVLLCNVHPKAKCEGRPCTIHNRTNHRMRSFIQYWRSDRALMERLCPACFCGHPDPDEYKLTISKWEGVHGCCGACSEIGCQAIDQHEAKDY